MDVDKSYNRITKSDKNSPNPNQPDLFGNENLNFGDISYICKVLEEVYNWGEYE